MTKNLTCPATTCHFEEAIPIDWLKRQGMFELIAKYQVEQEQTNEDQSKTMIDEILEEIERKMK